MHLGKCAGHHCLIHKLPMQLVSNPFFSSEIQLQVHRGSVLVIKNRNLNLKLNFFTASLQTYLIWAIIVLTASPSWHEDCTDVWMLSMAFSTLSYGFEMIKWHSGISLIYFSVAIFLLIKCWHSLLKDPPFQIWMLYKTIQLYVTTTFFSSTLLTKRAEHTLLFSKWSTWLWPELNKYLYYAAGLDRSSQEALCFHNGRKEKSCNKRDIPVSQDKPTATRSVKASLRFLFLVPAVAHTTMGMFFEILKNTFIKISGWICKYANKNLLICLWLQSLFRAFY